MLKCTYHPSVIVQERLISDTEVKDQVPEQNTAHEYHPMETAAGEVSFE